MIAILKKSMTSIDYFGKPVRITFDKQKKFKTPIGGILSLIVYSIILSLIITNGLNLLMRKQPKTSATSLYEIEAPMINVTNLNTVFAAYFLTNEFIPFFDPSYFSYEIFQFLVIRNSNGNSNVSFIPLQIKNCSMYYGHFEKKGFGDDFIQNSLSEGVCFDVAEREIIIGGKFTGNYFSNILFRFNRCLNKTNSDIYNHTNNNHKEVICKSHKEIDQKIQGGFFQFYYIDKNIDLNNYSTPFTDYFTRYFILLDPGSQKFVDLYFKSVNITSDAGIIFEEPEIYNGMVFDYYREQIDTYSKNEKIIELLVNSSNNVMKYNIIFTKFQDFAASIGGLMNVLIQIGSFLTMIFNEHKMYEKMINCFFNIINIDEKNKKISKIISESFVQKFKNEKNKKNFVEENSNLPMIENLNAETHLKNKHFSHVNFGSLNFSEKNKCFSMINKRNFNNLNCNNSNIINEDKNKEEKDEQEKISIENDFKKNCTSYYLNTIRTKKDKYNDFRDLVEHPDYNIQNVSEINKNTTKENNFIKKENLKTEYIIDKDNFKDRNVNNIGSATDEIFKSENLKNIFLHKINVIKKTNETKISFKWFEIIIVYLCPFTNNVRKKKNLFLKAKMKLFKFLDLLEIVNCIQEFNKLKKVLLTKEEIDIFNIRLKPKIFFDEKYDFENSKKKIEQSYLDILKSYKQVLLKSKYDYKSKRLAMNIDPTIKNIFDEIISI